MTTLLQYDNGTVLQRAANGSLHFTTFCANETAALRKMIDIEITSMFTVTRCTKLGDGTFMVQGGEV